MDPANTPLYVLAFAIMAHGVLWFFKSPRQESESQSARITALDTRITALSMRYEGSNGRHTHALEKVEKAIDRLTERFDNFMGGGGNRSGLG